MINLNCLVVNLNPKYDFFLNNAEFIPGKHRSCCVISLMKCAIIFRS